MILGNSDELMAAAGNEVIRMQGGIVVAVGSKLVSLPLPIGGLMSTAPFAEVAEGSRAVSRALREAGCTLNYAFMTLSLLALVVLPELHLSDKGLIRITPAGFERVDLFL